MEWFSRISPEEIQLNVFSSIGTQWMLLNVEAADEKTAMTASWGGFGVMYNRNAAFCMVKPSKATYLFMEQSDYFSLSFFDESYRDILVQLGNVSAREGNKLDSPEVAARLTPEHADRGFAFREAELTIICRKIARVPIHPEHLLAPEVHEQYAGPDMHILYAGAIHSCLVPKRD